MTRIRIIAGNDCQTINAGNLPIKTAVKSIECAIDRGLLYAGGKAISKDGIEKIIAEQEES